MKALKFILAFFTVFYACEKSDDPKEKQFLSNSNLEGSSSSPWDFAGDTTLFKTDWTSEQSFSSDHSLMISRVSGQNDFVNFAYWWQNIDRNLPYDKQLTLSARIKGVNLIGSGLSIAIRADGEFASLQFATTQGSQQITGTFDWTEFTIDLPALLIDAKVIYIFLLMLPGTSGIAYFDDITLKEKSL
jgi:hypothetical protein